MKYTDRVYGEVEITESAVLELINSTTLQRLKDIDQAGYSSAHFPNTEHSRFEHSVGVYILLKRFKAPLEEQVAGLIHDVSHSALSHCIDYILDTGSQSEHNHQDNVFEEYVKKTPIPSILKKYNFFATISHSIFLFLPLASYLISNYLRHPVFFCRKDKLEASRLML